MLLRGSRTENEEGAETCARPVLTLVRVKAFRHVCSTSTKIGIYQQIPVQLSNMKSPCRFIETVSVCAARTVRFTDMPKLISENFAIFLYEITKTYLNYFSLFYFYVLIFIPFLSFSLRCVFGELYIQVDRLSELQSDKFIPRGLHVASVLGIHRNHT